MDRQQILGHDDIASPNPVPCENVMHWIGLSNDNDIVRRMVESLNDLQKLIRDSESAKIELKREISVEVLEKLSTKIASFANLDGGFIVFGVADDRDPLGCTFDEKDRDRISQRAANCHPPVGIDFSEVSWGPKHFLIVNVPKSPILHSDANHRFPMRVGNRTTYLDIAGIILQMRTRELLPRDQSWETPTRVERKREPIPELESSLIVNALGSNDVGRRLEALRDLATLYHRYIVLEDAGIAGLVGQVLQTGSDEEIDLVLELIRGLVNYGTPKEKETALKWMPRLREIGVSVASLQAAHRAFDVLLSIGDSGAADVLTQWVTESDDDRFQALQPGSLLANAWFFGMAGTIRQVMYDLLESENRERVRNRVSEILEGLRRAY